MAVDVSAAVFLVAIGVMGWMRGAVVQLVTLGAVLLLWFLFDLWFPPLDLPLSSLGPAFSDNPYLRKMVGFLGAYFAVVLVVAVVDALLRKKLQGMERADRTAGFAIGLVKGIVYAAALAWMVEASVLWKKPPHEPTPSWIESSGWMALVGPWNPVRVLTLREVMEKAVADVDRRRDEQGPGDDDSAEPLAGARRSDEETRRAIELERDLRVRALFKSSPIRKLMEETASESEWHGRGYGELVMDPRVREVLGDTEIADLLLGD